MHRAVLSIFAATAFSVKVIFSVAAKDVVPIPAAGIVHYSILRNTEYINKDEIKREVGKVRNVA